MENNPLKRGRGEWEKQYNVFPIPQFDLIYDVL